MRYDIIRSKRKTIGAEIRGGKLVVRAPLRAGIGEIERFLAEHRAWIEKHLAMAEAREKAKAGVRKLTPEEVAGVVARAKKVIPERVAYYAPRVGVTYGKIAIRRQKSRWGSCSAKGNLNFNCLLVLAPPEVLDSVVVHELCHRKQMNHSKKFYEEVLRVFPEYKARNKWLKDNGDMLLAMLG